MTFQVTKTYGHERGLSVAFRQAQAGGHCSKLHGYALAIGLTFEADTLLNHWVIDFGALKPVEAWLREMFDHTLLVAMDDPERSYLEGLGTRGIARVQVIPALGCEVFAFFVFGHVTTWLEDNDHAPRVRVAQVSVAEHGANCARYIPPRQTRARIEF